jgi:hypothetical protein
MLFKRKDAKAQGRQEKGSGQVRVGRSFFAPLRFLFIKRPKTWAAAQNEFLLFHL